MRYEYRDIDYGDYLKSMRTTQYLNGIRIETVYGINKDMRTWLSLGFTYVQVYDHLCPTIYIPIDKDPEKS